MANQAGRQVEETLRGQLRTCTIEELELDRENPRLPEHMSGEPASAILEFLYDTAVLEELAQSFVDNGYFPHEPLVVTASAHEGRFTVLEGNRRLAALLILIRRPEAGNLAFDLEAEPAQLDRLTEVPCYEVPDRAEVYRFLGFRHIGGIKPWGPQAKARYLAREVDRLATDGVEEPFREVGRRVGSNAVGVRNSYVALSILRHARDELDQQVEALQSKRFGVWMRALNSPEVRAYIGFGKAQTYAEVREALNHLRPDKLAEVIADLTPDPATRNALVQDSRDITDYGRVLASEHARSVLRKSGDLNLARQGIEEAELPVRLRQLQRVCELLTSRVQLARPSDALDDAAEGLLLAVRSLRTTVKMLGEPDE